MARTEYFEHDYIKDMGFDDEESCEDCGHRSSFRVSVHVPTEYDDNDNPLPVDLKRTEPVVIVSDKISCYSWREETIPATEFFSWFRDSWVKDIFAQDAINHGPLLASVFEAEEDVAATNGNAFLK